MLLDPLQVTSTFGLFQLLDCFDVVTAFANSRAMARFLSEAFGRTINYSSGPWSKKKMSLRASEEFDSQRDEELTNVNVTASLSDCSLSGRMAL